MDAAEAPTGIAGAWSALAALSADLLALLDGEGRIVWVNPAFERIGGIAATQARGQRFADLLGVEGSGAWPAIGEALARGRAVARTELPWRHPSGDTRWGALSAQPLPSDSSASARLAVCLHDLSEQRRLAELLETAQEFGRLGVWERKIPSGEGRWDRHVFRFFGMDPEAGTPDFDVAAQRIHPDDRQTADYPKSTQRAGKYEARYRVLLPDGSMQRIHSQWEVKNSPAGVPERTVGIMVDDTETYQLAQAFNDTSEQLRLAVDLGNIAIWRQDLRTNRMHYNYRAYQVLDIPPRPEGLSLEEVRAMIHPDDLPRVIAAAHTALASDRPVDMEARYRRSDGTWRYVLTRRMLRRDAKGEPLEFVGVALDVTEQVDKSRRANELAQRLEIATHSAGLGIFTRDPETEQGEWNAEMFRLMGRSPELGVPSRDEWVGTIIHPDDRAMMSTARESLLNSQQDTREEQYRVVWPGGEVRWMMNRARRVMRNGRRMIYGITIDVTERVRTEAALHSATERVALTAHSVGLGTWEWQPAGDTALWDEQMYRLRGREPQAVAPDSAGRRAIAHPDDGEHIERMLADAALQGRSAAYEFRVVWPDGSVHWLASRSTPVTDPDGRLRYIGVNWDITDNVTAEAERRDRLIAQRESEAKSQFLARMSHELRTPLNAVLGFAQLLQLDNGGASAEQRGRIEHILSAGEHLLSLINDVLDLSSLESGQLRLELQPVALDELIAEALPLVVPLADSFGVQVHTARIDGCVIADRTRLRQVLINLLSNAIKYNRQAGEATVEAAVRGAQVVLRVSDTGRGLTAEQRAHLFEPFNRLGIESEGIEGTGIGLAIVKTLVTHMGGSIIVDSQPGRGSTFEVLLPRADAAPAEPPPAQDAAPSVGRHERVGQLLYIEDNPINVMLLEEVVASRSRMAIVSEPTGERGVARARALRPDLVLVDMQLPDFDGFEVLRRLRTLPETAHTPCIAVSANAMPEDIRRALDAGFAEYWTKPISFNAFLRSLEMLLQERMT
ncbi:PAS domain-containing protein [Piscinibacter sp. XHJ-5]|uniref:PAS domain-containing protein n=1 Tax=Piscinibacter sp. XHJ-5 TaxID=3037797 RepID=UPI0024533DBA|nr:PAS domain-containing protein [Piscinibacter sp. XHJ-5]